ncbi:hypothetical protein Ddye_012864 [Dipteronia dyeriana]|uniref:Uncharacterized protein n=1 Tax=Dipteronia dyeriana TaxID=168575 RepID=A0AAE0CJN2_9ROSI|nr:hypothetical protein Ddye_012864 [Dipteronia dyeriana]
MDIQDPQPESKPKMDQSEMAAATAAVFSSLSPSAFTRRANSEASFCLQVDLAIAPIEYGSSYVSLEEIDGSEDDLFSTYIDVEKLGGSSVGLGDNNDVV